MPMRFIRAMARWPRMPSLPKCAATCGIVFIGPSAEAIRKMGDKAIARETMQGAGVPVAPGTGGFGEL